MALIEKDDEILANLPPEELKSPGKKRSINYVTK